VTQKIIVLAATGRLGRATLPLLEGCIAVGRDAAKLAVLPDTIETRRADFDDHEALTVALDGATSVLSCANAIHLPAILQALPPRGVERLVVMGSTRCFSRYPDATAAAVRRAQRLLQDQPIPAVLLLATLIYGAGGSVVDSIARLIERWPLLPLPGFGRACVQPIHIDDVASCLAAALVRPAAPGQPIVIAGPAPMQYRVMVETIAARRALRLRTLGLPAWPFRLAGQLPLGPIGPSLARLVEDRPFDITEMRQRLGVEPRAFAP
jgi:uncharacterized protein YbjT (DUF2867 family)